MIENISEQTIKQQAKEAYIVNMLVLTLYSNDVNQSECYHIIKKFKEQVLGYVEI